MVILLFIIALFIIGIVLMRQEYDYFSFDYGLLGAIITFLSVILLVAHLAFWLPKGYEYEKEVARREAFVATIQQARIDGRTLELAAMAKDIAAWNQDLAEKKYYLTRWLPSQYIDTRFKIMQPIR